MIEEQWSGQMAEASARVSEQLEALERVRVLARGGAVRSGAAR